MTRVPAPPVLRGPGQITAAWLGEVVGGPVVEIAEVVAIGTGQMSQSHLVRFAPAVGGVEDVVVKLASEDDTSRATGVGLGSYEREVAFYRELAARVHPAVPGCRAAAYDATTGHFTLVLDHVDGHQGDQILGCDLHHARLALSAHARLQARVAGDPEVAAAGWLAGREVDPVLLGFLLDAFLDRYADRIAPAHVEVCRALVAHVAPWAEGRAADPRSGLVHGDYRLDNLLFSASAATVVDWQTVTWGPALTDVAYFLGSGLETGLRRAEERSLVEAYLAELAAEGGPAWSIEEVWPQYRAAAFLGVLMPIGASILVERTDRGDDMFMHWLARAAEQVLDLDALDLLPA